MYRHYASFIYYNLLIEKLNVTVKHHMCALARTTLSLVLRCCVRAYPVYDNSQYKRMCLNTIAIQP